MESRVIELESKLAFQEHMINELNDVITDQQKQLDQLREEQQLLNQRLQSISESSPVSNEKEPPPPHY
jgi:SlyX protein